MLQYFLTLVKLQSPRRLKMNLNYYWQYELLLISNHVLEIFWKIKKEGGGGSTTYMPIKS